MNIEIKDLELNNELDVKTKVATRGGLAALTVHTSKALIGLGGGCSASHVSACASDQLNDADPCLMLA